MHLFLLITFITIVLFLYKLWTQQSSAFSYIRNFNGPYLYPIVGALPHVINKTQYELSELLKSWHRTYESPLRFSALNENAVQLYKPEHVEVLMKSRVNISKARPGYDYISEWLGRGLLTSTGQMWHKQRKLLTPTFHYDILREFVPIMDAHSRTLVNWLKHQPDAIDIRQPLSLATLDVIAETAMGRRMNSLEQTSAEDAAYVRAVSDFGNLLIDRMGKPWLQWDWLYGRTENGRKYKAAIHTLHSFTQKKKLQVIQEREETMSCSNETDSNTTNQRSDRRRLAFLDLLLRMKREGQMDARQVREQVDTFMFEGHDTTATGLMYCCFAMGTQQKHQAQVQEELDSVLGKNSTNVEITISDLNQMELLERCIKETMRLYPPVPVVGRMLDENIQIEPDKIIPRDVRVPMFIQSLHRDPTHWPEPDKFDPDRFTTDNSQHRHPFAYAPFSGGMRNCIGQRYAMFELKMVMAHILHNFTLECTQTIDELKPVISMVLRPDEPIWVKFTSRN